MTTDFQKAVLGAFINDNKMYHRHKSALITKAFNDPDLIPISEYIFKRLDEGKTVNFLILKSEFKGKAVLFDIAKTQIEGYTLSEYIEFINVDYRRIEYIKTLNNESRSLIEGDDPDEVRNRIDQTFTNIDGNKLNSKLTWTDRMRTALDRIILARETNGLVGIDTCMNFINSRIGGFQKNNLYYVAARPGMGKTTYMLQVCNEASKLKTGVTVFFSLEMPTEQIIHALISIETGIPKMNMLDGKNIDDAKFQKIMEAADKVEKANIIIIDDCHSIEEIKSALLDIKFNYPINLCVIDFIQEVWMTGSRGMNRNDELTIITRTLKKISGKKYADCPIVALSQLSREVEKKGERRPMLSHLRDSGSIEQSADGVIFVYRPEYYDEYTEEQAELILAKNRHGGLGVNNFEFKYPYNAFTDISQTIDINTSEEQETSEIDIIRASRARDTDDLMF